MEGLLILSLIISLILLIWFVSTMNNVVRELRIQNRQQALLLAYKKAESSVSFGKHLEADFEHFYAMKRHKIFDQ
ncbi:Tfp pilus assembly protein PilX [Novosphingobium chloroacetimidivorans]|uniref:Tfp pilus assembly protein PilX n=1 Tax=Novosphingobium chloroacetimidivorans TaxID=1428314 RepID=A0A7W7KAW4_9SPHN|nr:hypothetical protein [Novosphingobium chloroacetimidivorans]MBB4859454.1 Tfp pilus assembly protein PilX [Novosphingobium chloroacetimidivorans]